MEKFAKIQKDIKENLPLLVLIPSLLGGIWQIFELLRIGISYLRFFSITQLVSDGIIIGFLLLIGFLIIYLIKPKSFLNSLAEENVVKISGLITLSLIFGLTIAIIFYNDFYLNKKEYAFSDLLILILLIIFFLTLFTALTIKIFYKFNKDRKLEQKIILHYQNKTIVYKILRKVGGFLALFIFTTLFILAIISIIEIRNIIYTSNDFKNFYDLKEKILSKYKNVSSVDILYFNDKYTFVEIDSCKKKQIIVYKTDDVFYPKLE